MTYIIRGNTWNWASVTIVYKITYNLTFTLSHNWLPIPETHLHSEQKQTTINSIFFVHSIWKSPPQTMVRGTNLFGADQSTELMPQYLSKFYFVNHCKCVHSHWFMNCLCTFVKYCCYFFPLWFVWAVPMINNNQCYLMDGQIL